ncbi:MAG: LytR/AlgR family response regulator transcription factor [Eubacterium sp.]
MKNKINIYICDDSHSFIDIIESKLKSILLSNQRPYEITTFSAGRALIEVFAHCTADVVFLDIDMPSMTGFEAAAELQKIKSNVNIVFITSHEDKVFQSYEFHPFWFVRKSHLEDLYIVLSGLLTKIDSEREEEQRIFKLITENKMIEIDINEVIYIQAYKHYIIIKNSTDTEIQARCKISDAEQQLFPFYFVRIQNSVIINCRFISKLTSRTVVLLNKEEFNISRDKIDYVKAEYQKFIRSR